MALIKAQDMDLKTFFTTNTYLIPEYQRSYAWTKTELEDLWDDIKQLVDSTNELDHFLGQIVIHSENIKSSKKEKISL